MSDGLPEKRFLTRPEAEAAQGLAESLGLRLTRDAARPGPAAGEPIEDPERGQAPVEVVLTPDGRVYMRHIGREAAEILADLGSASALAGWSDGK